MEHHLEIGCLHCCWLLAVYATEPVQLRQGVPVAAGHLERAGWGGLDGRCQQRSAGGCGCTCAVLGTGLQGRAALAELVWWFGHSMVAKLAMQCAWWDVKHHRQSAFAWYCCLCPCYGD
jgi:hypothetical protein